MNRNFQTEVLVLRARRVGEIHRSLSLLTPDRGILSVMAHGALKPKSRWRGVSDLFRYNRASLYHDPVKNSFKLNDMEPLGIYDNLTRDLEKFYTANLAAEIIYRTQAGGHQTVSYLFYLMVEALETLNSEPEEYTVRVRVQFLLRFLISEGICPDFDSCGKCGRSYGRTDSAFWDTRDEALVCESCRAFSSDVLTAGDLNYLRHTRSLGWDPALRVSLHYEMFRRLGLFLTRLVAQGLEITLKTTEIARGVF